MSFESGNLAENASCDVYVVPGVFPSWHTYLNESRRLACEPQQTCQGATCWEGENRLLRHQHRRPFQLRMTTILVCIYSPWSSRTCIYKSMTTTLHQDRHFMRCISSSEAFNVFLQPSYNLHSPWVFIHCALHGEIMVTRLLCYKTFIIYDCSIVYNIIIINVFRNFSKTTVCDCTARKYQEHFLLPSSAQKFQTWMAEFLRNIPNSLRRQMKPGVT